MPPEGTPIKLYGFAPFSQLQAFSAACVAMAEHWQNLGGYLPRQHAVMITLLAQAPRGAPIKGPSVPIYNHRQAMAAPLEQRSYCYKAADKY